MPARRVGCGCRGVGSGWRGVAVGGAAWAVGGAACGSRAHGLRVGALAARRAASHPRPHPRPHPRHDHSQGLRGGLMFTRGLLAWLNKHGVQSLGPLSLDADHT